MRISDWSSDVCSSDLGGQHIAIPIFTFQNRSGDDLPQTEIHRFVVPIHYCVGDIIQRVASTTKRHPRPLQRNYIVQAATRSSSSGRGLSAKDLDSLPRKRKPAYFPCCLTKASPTGLL